MNQIQKVKKIEKKWNLESTTIMFRLTFLDVIGSKHVILFEKLYPKVLIYDFVFENRFFNLPSPIFWSQNFGKDFSKDFV